MDRRKLRTLDKAERKLQLVSIPRTGKGVKRAIDTYREDTRKARVYGDMWQAS